MSSTTKREYDVVKEAADELVRRLKPNCARSEIAGSLRRRRRFIGDIEIVAIPMAQMDLFGEPQTRTEVDAWVDMQVVDPDFVLHKNGGKYKQFTLRLQGELYKVDLFLQPDSATWGVNFLLRTGSAEFSKWMVTPMSKGGAMPNRYRVSGARVWEGETVLDTPEEECLFDLWGLDFVDPINREREGVRI